MNDPAVFRDITGEPLVISKSLFTIKKTGKIKAAKRGREQYLLLLADALKSPDEIWTRIEWIASLQKSVVRRRYIAQFQINGELTPMLSVFEIGDDGWIGVTTFAAEHENYLECLRIGVNVYQRK